MKLFLIKLLVPVVFLISGFYLWNNITLFENLGYSYLPFSLGLTIGLFNYRMNVFRIKLIQLLAVLLISLITFYFNLFTSLFLPKLFNLNEINSTGLFKIIVFMVSPLLVLSSYFWFYKIKFTLINFFVITISTVIIYLYAYFQHISYSGITNQLVNPYLIWQIVVAFTLQLVLYKNELLSMFDNRKS
jgi:hypothetical protein